MGESASVAIQSARVYLNDINGITWTDAILMPILQEAFRELIQELDLNGAGVLKQQTDPITVYSGALDLGANQPYNILEPISMMERNPGEDADFFLDMIQVGFLPEVDKDENLIYWSFNGQIISFVGATQNKEVVLRYNGWLPVPQLQTDPINVISGARFLGPRIASLAYGAIGKNGEVFDRIAEKNLYKIMQRTTKAAQYPVRRKGYRSAKTGIHLGPGGTFGSY